MTQRHTAGFKWQIKPLMCHTGTSECNRATAAASAMISGSESDFQESVATAACVAREAVGLMSVHEQRADVGEINTGGNC